MADKINIVLLAAGKGTRLNMDVPKPLCPFMGKTLLDFVLKEVTEFCHEENFDPQIDLIVGHQKELIEAHVSKNYSSENISFVHQEQQLGTGHAVKVYFEKKKEAVNQPLTFIMCADTPLLKKEIFKLMLKKIREEGGQGVAATFEKDIPTGYGRIVHSKSGFEIVEEKDASADIKRIKEVNSGLYLLKTSHLEENIFNLKSENNANEFYLTDLFKPHFEVTTQCFENGELFEGVNNLIDLERVQKIAMLAKVRSLQMQGVQFLNAESIYIEDDVEIGSKTIVFPNVFLHGKTSIKEGVSIEANVVIKDSIIESNTKILAGCYIESAHVGEQVSLGPYARLRTGTEIGAESKIGNFVETKKAKLDKGVKVSHLSYVGDAEIGENTNIGCGFITCNYDGKNKHLTKIGRDSFIGSDCQMIAPINLGDRVYVGSGSTINKDVPDDAFAIARERQVTKPEMAKKFIKK